MRYQYQTNLLKAKDYMWRPSEVVDDSKKTVLPYSTGSIHTLTHRTCTNSNQTKFSTEKGRQCQIPNQQAVCSSCLLDKEKLVFSNEITLIISTTYQAGPCSIVVGYHKMDSIVLCLFGFCLLWDLFLVCFVVVFFCVLFVLILDF